MGRVTAAAALPVLVCAIAMMAWLPGASAYNLTNCTNEQLVCQNGGWMDSSNCLTLAPCGTDPPGSGAADIVNWWTQHNCSCPPGFFSPDCSLRSPQHEAGDSYRCPNQYWDGTFLNLNNPEKHMHCAVDLSPDMWYLSLRLHRVVVAFSMDATGYGTGRFRLISRHRDKSPNHPPCFGALDDMDCALSQCYGYTDADSGEAVYTCDGLSCTSCGENPLVTWCSPLLGALITSMKPPFVLTFHNINETRGESRLHVKTSQIPLYLRCLTGTCTDNPIDRNERLPPVSTAWVTVTILAGCVGILFLAVVLGVVTTRRSKGGRVHTEHDVRLIRQLIEAQHAQLPQFGLVFDSVTYTIELQRPVRTRRVLKGVSGYLPAGTLCALLGPSGAGKSSFMDILVARYKSGQQGGYVGFVSDSMSAPRAPQYRGDIISYVLQHDHFLPTMTVREALVFSARMRLPPSYTESMIDEKVSLTLAELSIDHIANSLIGSADTGGGISGGERKRVAIGMELVTDPCVLLLDEPTSGLDSFSTEVVMRVLRETAVRGTTVLMSIHQPSSKIFYQFDRVLLLSRIGAQLFLGEPDAAMDYMAQECGHEPADQWVNPAEFLLQVAASDDDGELHRLARVFSESKIGQAVQADARAVVRPGSYQQDERLPVFVRRRPGMCARLALLAARSFKNVSRDPSLLYMQLLVTIGVAVLIGGIYWKLGIAVAGQQNRLGVLFFFILYFSLTSLTSIESLVAERTIYLRERFANMYTTLPYFAAKLLCDVLPLRVIPPTAFGSIAYYMIGLQDDLGKFAMCLVILIQVNLVATAACLAISAGSSSRGQANLIVSLYFIFSMLFGGLLLNNDSSSPVISLRYASFFQYAYEALVVNEFTDLKLFFDPPFLKPPANIMGQLYVTNLGMDPERLNFDMLMLVVMFVCFVCLALLFLSRKHPDAPLFGGGLRRLLDDCFAPFIGANARRSGASFAAGAAAGGGADPPHHHHQDEETGEGRDDDRKLHAPVLDRPVSEESNTSRDHLQVMATSEACHLPSFGLLAWKVTYDVPGPPPRRILKGVTIYAQQGELVGILGSSGAGKSSFMDILANRAKIGVSGGYIDVVSASAVPHRRDDVISYVMQHDLLLPTQTVREALMFSARMRLPSEYTERQIRRRVDDVMRDLKIAHLANSRIGDADHGGGLSGGERKRVSIGVELVAEPRVLLLDEPTSGLDSRSTEVVLDVLHTVALHNCTTVVLSIHQPTSASYMSFDKVLVLTKNGRQAWYGPPMDAIAHMGELGFRPAQRFVNPSEFLLDIASDSNPAALEQLEDHYLSSPTYVSMRREIRHLRSFLGAPHRESVDGPSSAVEGEKKEEESGADSAVGGGGGGGGLETTEATRLDLPPSTDGLPIFRRSKPSSLRKVYLLCHRAFLRLVRDPSLLLVQLVVTVLVATGVGIVFYDQGRDLQGCQNRNGAFFFTILYFSLVSISSIGELVTSRTLFYRERAARTYGTGEWLFSKFFADLVPLRVVPTLAYAFIVYFLMGLNTSSPQKFINFLGVLLAVNIVSTAGCFMWTAATRGFSQANLLSSLWLVFSLLYGGILLAANSDTSPLIQLKWTSFFRYAWDLMMINEFKGLTVTLQPKGAFDPKVVDGSAWARSWAVDVDLFGLDAAMLIVFMVLFAYLTYVFSLRTIVRGGSMFDVDWPLVRCVAGSLPLLGIAFYAVNAQWRGKTPLEVQYARLMLGASLVSTTAVTVALSIYFGL